MKIVNTRREQSSTFAEVKNGDVVQIPNPLKTRGSRPVVIMKVESVDLSPEEAINYVDLNKGAFGYAPEDTPVTYLDAELCIK